MRKKLEKIANVIAQAALIGWGTILLILCIANLFVGSTTLFAIIAVGVLFGFPVVWVLMFVAMALETRW